MSPIDKATVMNASCSQCDAQPGERCKSKTGRPYARPYFHVRRMAVIDPNVLRPRRGLPKARYDHQPRPLP